MAVGSHIFLLSLFRAIQKVIWANYLLLLCRTQTKKNGNKTTRRLSFIRQKNFNLSNNNCIKDTQTIKELRLGDISLLEAKR